MALFRRRSTAAEAEPAVVDDETGAELDDAGVPAGDEAETADESDPTAAGKGSGAFDRSTGPFDEAEADQADQDLPRIDLGSLRIPGLPGLGVQIEADEATQEVHAVTAIADDAAVQLRAFAAPRSEGIWDEIRAETLQEIRATAGARVADAVGAFGPELRAIVPARSPEGQQIRQPVRFAGVDGPRWFLRVVFLGKAAVEPDPSDDLHRLVRETIVVRGTEAMAPRQPLALTLPAQPPQGVESDEESAEGSTAEGAESEAQEEAEEDAEGPSGARFKGIDPYERGPEITEVR